MAIFDDFDPSWKSQSVILWPKCCYMVSYSIIVMSEIDMDTKVLLKLINYNDFLIFKDFCCICLYISYVISQILIWPMAVLKWQPWWKYHNVSSFQAQWPLWLSAIRILILSAPPNLTDWPCTEDGQLYGSRCKRVILLISGCILTCVVHKTKYYKRNEHTDWWFNPVKPGIFRAP